MLSLRGLQNLCNWTFWWRMKPSRIVWWRMAWTLMVHPSNFFSVRPFKYFEVSDFPGPLTSENFQIVLLVFVSWTNVYFNFMDYLFFWTNSANKTKIRYANKLFLPDNDELDHRGFVKQLEKCVGQLSDQVSFLKTILGAE